ncbi:MAG: DsbA family protein [Chloroflexi bacterium]|nr:DsbA family protein [Chloroflexota bacterium]
MGLERVERLKQEYPVAVDVRAFFLRPDIGPGGMVRPSRPGEAEPGQPVTGHLGEMAQQAGLIMRRAPKTSYTRPALEATEYAKQHGRLDAFHKLLLKAYWEDGQDLEDRAVLRAAAEAVGLDPEDLERHLNAGTYGDAVEEQMDEAQQLGITGIPAFIVGEKYLFMGAQPYEFFKMVVERAIQEQTAQGQ